jgi:hypothetical protein
MGRFFDSLTKSGLQDSSGNTTFYDSPQAALDAGNAALAKAPHPTVSMMPPTQVNVAPAGALPPGVAGPEEDPENPRPPVLQTSGGGVQLSTPAPNVGKIVKPSVLDINVDAAGNQKRITPNSGLTKLGALFSILMGGADTLASWAMDWVRGRSNTGAGIKGATEMPMLRAARQRAIAEQQLQQQHLGAENAELQARTQASVITSKAANGYHFKTGQRKAFYLIIRLSGKSDLQWGLSLIVRRAAKPSSRSTPSNWQPSMTIRFRGA